MHLEAMDFKLVLEFFRRTSHPPALSLSTSCLFLFLSFLVAKSNLLRGVIVILETLGKTGRQYYTWEYVEEIRLYVPLSVYELQKLCDF